MYTRHTYEYIIHTYVEIPFIYVIHIQKYKHIFIVQVLY